MLFWRHNFFCVGVCLSSVWANIIHSFITPYIQGALGSFSPSSRQKGFRYPLVLMLRQEHQSKYYTINTTRPQNLHLTLLSSQKLKEPKVTQISTHLPPGTTENEITLIISTSTSKQGREIQIKLAKLAQNHHPEKSKIATFSFYWNQHGGLT